MLTRFRTILVKLIPVRHLIFIVGLIALVGGAILIFSGDSKLDKYILPISMLVAWSFSLFAVLSGYLYLSFEATKKGFWAWLGSRIRTFFVRVFELCFLATTMVLIWLSVRSVTYVLTH